MSALRTSSRSPGAESDSSGVVAHLRSAYRWMADDVDAQSDDDGGRWRMATADGGEVAYLRHAEVGVEENPGTLRCALRTGLRKSAVALRRESANRGMSFLQPLFGGFFAYGDVLRRWGNQMMMADDVGGNRRRTVV